MESLFERFQMDFSELDETHDTNENCIENGMFLNKKRSHQEISDNFSGDKDLKKSRQDYKDSKKRVNARNMTDQSALLSGSLNLSYVMASVEAGLFSQLMITLADLSGSQSEIDSKSKSQWDRESVRILHRCLLMCWTGFSKLSSLQASRHVAFQLYSRMRDMLIRLRASGKPLLSLERLVGECEGWMRAQHPCVFPSNVILDHPFGALEMTLNADYVRQI